MRYFVLLSNYVTLGLQKHVFLIKSFFRTLWRRVESTSQLSCVLFCQFAVSFPTLELSYKSFSYNKIFFMTLGLRSFVVSWITYGSIVWNNVWKLRFVFLRVTHFLFRHNYVIYLFDVITFFDDVRITLYFGTLELLTEITLLDSHFLVTFVCNQKMTEKIRNYYVIC